MVACGSLFPQYCAMLAVNCISLGDDDLFYTVAYGVERVLELGYHSSCYRSVFDQRLEFPGADAAYHALVIIGICQHALLLEAEDEGNIIIWCKSHGRY